MSVNQEPDGFDQFNINDGDIQRLQAEQREKALAIASRYHRVYAQNADGGKLLEDMLRSFVMVPIVRGDDTQFDAGIRAGRADVVHQIIKNIKLAENPGGDNSE